MLYWALVFFICAIVAAIFGFSGIAAQTAIVAQIMFFVFTVIFIVLLIAGLFYRNPYSRDSSGWDPYK